MALTQPAAEKLLVADRAVTPPPAYGPDHPFATPVEDREYADDEDDESPSFIDMQIFTPLVITGDNNLCTIDTSASASRIAMTVVGALRQLSIGANGLPMIDEQGRPRPIKIDVMADTRVEGSRNVIGERAVLTILAGGGGPKKREGGEANVGNVGNKRQRAMSEPVEVERKKARTE